MKRHVRRQVGRQGSSGTAAANQNGDHTNHTGRQVERHVRRQVGRQISSGTAAAHSSGNTKTEHRHPLIEK